MQQIILFLGLLFSSVTMESVYNVGTIDSISGTNNGGTGYGNATQASAIGYVTTAIGGVADTVNATAIQPDGKTVVVGSAGTSMVIARYNINGTLDTTKFHSSTGFVSVASGTIGTGAAVATGVAIKPNGKIVVYGNCTTSGGASYFIAQYTPAGVLDTGSFGSGAGFITQNIGVILHAGAAGTPATTSVDTPSSMTIDSAGHILVTGSTSITQAVTHIANGIYVVRYSSSGVLDTAFNSGAVVGGGNAAGIVTAHGVALITISAAVTLAGNGIVLDNSGNILVVGSTTSSSDMFIARIFNNASSGTIGTLDTAGFNSGGGSLAGTLSFSVGGTGVARGVGVQSATNSNRIIVVGTDGTNAVTAGITNAGALDTGTFGTSSSGYISSVFGETTATAYGVAIQSNDKIVIGGQTTTSNEFLIARFVANGSALDTSSAGSNIQFNGSTGYSITQLGFASLGTALSMQQNGSFILAGTVASSPVEFGVARYLGDNNIQGCMDYTYNPLVGTSPGSPGFRVYPTDIIPSDLPKVTAMYPAAGGNVYILTSESGSINSRLVQLNSSGTASATYVVIAQPTPNDVIADSQGRAVVVGTGISNAWLARYYNNSGVMTIDGTFNSGSVVSVTSSLSLFKVCEQGSSRLVAIGQLSTTPSTGIMVGYTETGAADTSFGSGGSTYNTIANATFNDMIIDTANGIYIAYQYTTGNSHIYIQKFLANGSGIDSSFATNTSGDVDTGWLYTSYNAPCLSFDNNGNIVIATTNTVTGTIAVQSYGPTSSSAPVVNSCSITTATTGLSSPIITKLQCDTNNRLIFTGYDVNDFFVGRLVLSGSTYILDTTFAPYSSCPGILKTMYSTNDPSDGTTPARVSNSVCINSNGAILFGGYENISGSNTVSVVGQVVGNTGGTVYTQVNRFPTSSATGTINLSFGTNGALDLNTTTSVPHGQPKAMNVLASGKILLADANGTNTILSQLTSTYTLDTGSFGSTTGSITLTGLVTPTAIMVDATAANYYILGSNGSHGVIYKVNAAGTSGGTAFVTTTLTSAYGITQQASGRILVAGYDSTHSGGSGVIASYTPAGALDTSFNLGSATPGYWYTGVASPIMSISVGTTTTHLDRIYITYSDSGASSLGNAVVQQLLENGTSYAPTTGTGAFTPITTGFSDTVNGNTQLRMQLDVSGKIVLAAATASSYGTTPAIKAIRYPANGGAADVGPVSVLTGTANQVLENILTLSNATTLILAAVPNATATSAFMSVAQLNASFVLDPTFYGLGTPGYLTTNVPSSLYTPVMDDFYAIDVIAAGGILVSGDNSQTASTADPYLTQIISTATPTKVSQSATSTPAAGALDTTYNPTGTTPGFVNLASELQTTQFPAATTAKVLLQNSNGTYYIAGSTSTHSYVTFMNDEDVQNVTFGLVTIAGSGKTNVSSMLLGQDGNLLVAGAGAGTSGSAWLVNLNATTGAVVFTASTVLDSNYAIAQQSNGRILVAGVRGGVGTIIAYNSVTGAVDTTFGVNGMYTATGYGAINSMIVDASNNIYFIVNESGAPNRGFIIGVNAFGTSTKFSPNNIITSSTVAANNHLVFDQAGNLTIVGVDTTAQAIMVKTCLSSNGAVTSSCTLTQTGAASVATGIVIPNVTDILVDLNSSPGKVILTGYDSNTSPNTPFILRVQAVVASGLDTTFNASGGNPGVQTYDTLTSGVTTNWYAGMINADGKITVAGYASALTTPYTMRVYGDEFIGQYSPSLTASTAGTPGTIDTNFGTSGEVLLAGLSGGGALATATPQVVVPTTSGQYYIALQNPTSVITQIIRLTNSAVLDGNFGSSGFATNITPGVTDMIVDGSNQLVVVGTNSTGSPYGWITRYVAGNGGTLDTTFNGGGIVSFDPVVVVSKVVQQTLGRYVLAGQLTGLGGNGGLVAVVSGGTNAGHIDTTFNSNGVNPGYYDSGVATEIYALISDVYDRLIIAYKNGTGIDIRRLTSAGQIDTTFGSAGTITGAIANADSASQIYLAFDASGNIVVSAHINDGANKIAVKAYANTTGTSVVETELDITGLTAPTLTRAIATSDGKILLSGYQSGTNNMWVARVKNNSGAYAFDTAFAPSTGIMQFQFDGSATARTLNSIAIYGDGEIAMVGTETDGTVNPFLSMAYNNPYTSQDLFCQDSKPVGTNDTTLGASSATATALGVTFFASSGADATSGQVARAITLQDDAHILVAVDGGLSSGSTTPSDIYLKMFTIDGTPDTTFGTNGQQTVLSSYANQNVNDMVTFTVGGVHKAILAGYTYNSALPSVNQYSSLLLQYNLDTHALDTANFGGFDENPAGIAFGDGQKLFTVGQQSNGRIIAAGLSKSNLGLLLAYTIAGKLDTSFGNDGYQSVNTGSTGIYSHVIDSKNRVVIGYVGGTVGSPDGVVHVARMLADGSGLDSSFDASASYITGATSISNVKVAVDSSDNVYVAAGVTGNSITVASYSNATGHQTHTVTKTGTQLGDASGVYTMARTIVDTAGNVIVVAYDTNVKTTLVMRLTSSLVLDTANFNAPNGYLAYAVGGGSTTQVATDALIHPDGRILVVGSES